MISRRKFVALSAGAAAAAMTACDRSARELTQDLRRFIGSPEAAVLEGDLTAPAAAELDAVSHTIGRLTFGTRPGEYARVAKMGVAAFIDEQLAPEKLADDQCERVVRHEFEDLGDPESHLFTGLIGGKGDPIQQMFPTLAESNSGRVGD